MSYRLDDTTIELPDTHKNITVIKMKNYVGYAKKSSDLRKLYSALSPYTNYVTSVSGVYEADSFILNLGFMICDGSQSFTFI